MTLSLSRDGKQFITLERGPAAALQLVNASSTFTLLSTNPDPESVHTVYYV